MRLSFDFPKNTIVSCFFFIFLTIELYILVPAAIEQIFDSAAKLVTLIGIPSKEEKSEIKTHPVIVEVKIIKCSL